MGGWSGAGVAHVAQNVRVGSKLGSFPMRCATKQHYVSVAALVNATRSIGAAASRSSSASPCTRGARHNRKESRLAPWFRHPPASNDGGPHPCPGVVRVQIVVEGITHAERCAARCPLGCGRHFRPPPKYEHVVITTAAAAIDAAAAAYPHKARAVAMPRGGGWAAMWSYGGGGNLFPPFSRSIKPPQIVEMLAVALPAKHVKASVVVRCSRRMPVPP